MDEDYSDLNRETSPPYINKPSVAEILSKYIIDEGTVKKYEDAVAKSEDVKNKLKKYIISAYFFWLITISVLSPSAYGLRIGINSSRYETLGIVTGILLTIGAAILFIIMRIAKSRANDLPVSYKDVVYHNIAKSIEAYTDGEYDKTKEYIESTKNILEIKGNDVLSEHTNVFLHLNSVSMNSDSNDLDFEDFHVLGHFLIDELSTAYVVDEAIESVRPDSTDEEIKKSYPYRDMVSDYIGNKVSNPTIRRIWPYVVAFPFVILIYLYIGPIESQIVAVFYIGVVEKLHNPDIDE